MDALTEYRDRWLPCRMRSIETMGLSLALTAAWTTPPKLGIYFDERLTIEGNAWSARTSAIETTS